MGPIYDIGHISYYIIGYEGKSEMHQKACGRWIFHVRPYSFYFEMPQIQTFSFSVCGMAVFEFGAFQNKMNMASREKYIFHMLFWGISDYPAYDSYLLLRNRLLRSRLIMV